MLLDMAAENTARRLPLRLFEIACEAIEADISACFKAAQKAAKLGNLAEVERQESRWEALSAKLERLIEGQLDAAGEARPAAPSLAA